MGGLVELHGGPRPKRAIHHHAYHGRIPGRHRPDIPTPRLSGFEHIRRRAGRRGSPVRGRVEHRVVRRQRQLRQQRQHQHRARGRLFPRGQHRRLRCRIGPPVRRHRSTIRLETARARPERQTAPRNLPLHAPGLPGQMPEPPCAGRKSSTRPTTFWRPARRTTPKET